MSVECIPSYTPLLYSDTGVCRDILIFLIFALKHKLWVLVRTASASHLIVAVTGKSICRVTAFFIILIISLIMLLMEHCFSFKVNPRVAGGLLVCNVSCSMFLDAFLPILTSHAPIIVPTIWFEA